MTTLIENKITLRNEFVVDICNIITTSKVNAIRSVDFTRVMMYWKLGERIMVEEQQGKERAEYGSYLLQNLAQTIEPEFGSGFSVRILEQCRQFYRTYPIANALRSQFNWYQYRLLIRIDNADKREYYEWEALHNAWTGRELERQINSELYERLLLSNDTVGILLCTDKNNAVVKFTLPENNKTIMASKYHLYLPSETQLITELKRELNNLQK
jgi:hypothetical protein